MVLSKGMTWQAICRKLVLYAICVGFFFGYIHQLSAQFHAHHHSHCDVSHVEEQDVGSPSGIPANDDEPSPADAPSTHSGSDYCYCGDCHAAPAIVESLKSAGIAFTGALFFWADSLFAPNPIAFAIEYPPNLS